MTQQLQQTDEDGFFTAFGTYLRVRWFNIKDFIKTVVLFWRKPRFALVDASLLCSYFFKSPYRYVREFTSGQEPYGETPLVTLQKIMRRVGLTKDDVVYELGCGRARTCFWLSLWLGCETVGVEHVDEFVAKATKLKNRFSVSNLCFIESDFLDVDWSPATVCYLYGTCLSTEAIFKCIEKVKTLKMGTKIVTISYSLLEYKNVPYIKLVESFEVAFPWGKTDCFIQERV